MNAVYSPEASVIFCRTTRRHRPEIVLFILNKIALSTFMGRVQLTSSKISGLWDKN
jgi:hypothetical protein